MGQWIGDTAVEAASVLHQSHKELSEEINKAHEILDTMYIDRWESHGETSRHLYLDERIQILRDRLKEKETLINANNF